MADYIKREDVIDRLEKTFLLQAQTARAIVEAIPAADAIEGLQKCVDDLEADNDKLCERIKDLSKWIPVTERLPDESFKNVLCCGARGGMFVGWVATKPEDGKIMAFVHGGNGRYITHWMPLPEPPKDGEA